MASSDPLHVTFDDGFGPIASAWNVDSSVRGEVRLAGSSAMMEYAVGREAGHGYGTYTIEAKLEGNEPGAAIIFWPGDNQWPGQELDLAEITPDGSGRLYGTVHWNAGGNDAYDAKIYEGIYAGAYHAFQMIWEPGRITYRVDGAEKAVFTDHVPLDFAHGGMNNTIGFLNNNPDTSITVRDVKYQPLGSPAPATPEVPVAPPAAPDVIVTPPVQQPDIGGELVVATPPPLAESTDPLAAWTDASGRVDWDALAAHVSANHAATGSWFI